MDISETLQTLYTATVEQNDGTYQITVPKREITTGTIAEGEKYRVALISTSASDTDATSTADTTQSAEYAGHQQEHDGPPVEEGERRDVEVENIGDQGDGIAKVERGYVVIVPETSVGDHVTVEMQQVRENVAFADVVDRKPPQES